MIEDRIQQDADSARVAQIDQFLQRVLVAELRVDFHIVFSIVFMVCCCREQRRKVNRVDAELA